MSPASFAPLLTVQPNYSDDAAYLVMTHVLNNSDLEEIEKATVQHIFMEKPKFGELLLKQEERDRYSFIRGQLDLFGTMHENVGAKMKNHDSNQDSGKKRKVNPLFCPFLGLKIHAPSSNI